MEIQMGLFDELGIRDTRPSVGEFATLDLTKENPHWIESTSYENVSERPTEDNLTYLSEILEKNVDSRYYLSEKACKGILRRADERGKELPTVLREALLGQAACDGKTYSVDQGAGKSGTRIMEDSAPTLACTRYGAPVINANSCGADASADSGEPKQDGPISIENHANDSRIKFSKDNKVQTLSSRMGTGGNNEPMVLESNYVPTDSDDKCGALCADDVKGAGNQYVGQGKCIVERVAVESHPQNSRVKIAEDGKNQPLSANTENDPSNGGLVLEQLCIACIEGNGTRPSHKGIGVNKGDKSYTLNATEEHAVATKSTYSMTTGCFVQINEEKTGTLEARDYKDPPIVTAVEPGIASREGGHCYENVSGTLRAEMGDNQMSVVYGADQYNGEVTEEKEGTLGENCGMSSGRNSVILNDQGGNSMQVESEDVSPTLRAQDHGHPPIVCNDTEVFGIGSKDSNAMKSSNPKSGIYKAETSKTIDLTGGNPACNQGGMAVVEAYGIERAAFNQGRNAKFGFAVDEEVEPTMVARGPNAVAVSEAFKKSSHPKAKGEGQGWEEAKVSDTLNTFDQGEQRTPTLAVQGVAKKYTVRRLTPTECARLQGLPDYWVKELGDSEPSEEEIDKWYEIFEDYRNTISHTQKPKPRSAVKRFLENPYSDSAAYKMFGNGIAVWCAVFVLAGIAEVEND